ncbi:phage nucleotide-binding protein [Yersinia rohdei]|uniref:Phage nucleotide-binding protein n=1 Tax=Yersinia rohdei TaxID=29485 RepID=A0A0U1HR87_YERRO|nr:ATP-binding protein [Yersinia rohdei]MDN0096222.1 ATP-binding protein [Yersinia rohdei]CNJ55870.1 phage nucleotide-binding protein [Yersinia rohdei]CQI88948.1 phage nucleotide-binding protein [Yersinia rohdei]
MKFEKAMRKKAKLRLALTGPSGSGKTYSALLIAKGIGGKTAVIDTEKGSASLYSDVSDFDVLELDAPFSPERFIEAIHAAEQAGYDNLIIDSITHEWGGVGGCLELVDTIAKAKFRGNSWSAWSEINPRHRLFLDAILSASMHVIATMRSKTETAQIEENGRKKVAKLGMKSEQRDGVEYEFTTVLDLVHESHHANATKDRTKLFSNSDPVIISEETGKRLIEWLESGINPHDEALKHFTALATSANSVEELKPAFEEAWRTLRGTEQQAIAKDVYDIRKSELEQAA